MINLEQENQELRDALSLIHDIASEGLRTDDGGAGYWQIEASSAAALGLTDMQRDITPETQRVKLFVTISSKEYDLLDLIHTKDQLILDLERAGYLQAIGKLQACEFAYDYGNDGISYLRITEEGRIFLEEREVANGNPN
jgi:hypothetical protein